jgi:hypothetical protein
MLMQTMQSTGKMNGAEKEKGQLLEWCSQSSSKNWGLVQK